MSTHRHGRMLSATQCALALLFAAACHGPVHAPAPVAPSPLERLPEQPLDEPPVTTDNVWASVTAPENIVHDEAGRPWVRNALYLGFTEGVPLARRQHLVDSVQARVVGGTTLGSTPLYLLVFEHLRPSPSDAALDALFRLADELRAHRDVRGVITLELTEPGA